MLEISSESIDILRFVKDYHFSKITLDIETLDTSKPAMWDEPMVSFAISFIPDNLIPLVVDMPTFAWCIEDTEEEGKLLLRLKEIFNYLKISTLIIGHNVAYELQCKKLEEWNNKTGYDIPKIIKRGKVWGLDFNFIKEFPTYDTIDVAYFKLNHIEHGIFGNYGLKKILKSEELESFFKIKRPSGLPKLGPAVSEYFKDGRYKEIILYNCSDVIVQSLFYRFMEHKLTVCPEKNGLISIKKNCEHIPIIIKLDEIETWKSLIKEV